MRDPPDKTTVKEPLRSANLVERSAVYLASWEVSSSLESKISTLFLFSVAMRAVTDESLVGVRESESERGLGREEEEYENEKEELGIEIASAWRRGEEEYLVEERNLRESVKKESEGEEAIRARVVGVGDHQLSCVWDWPRFFSWWRGFIPYTPQPPRTFFLIIILRNNLHVLRLRTMRVKSHQINIY